MKAAASPSLFGNENMSKKITYCTIVSANYLSRAKVLETSLKKYNPGAEFQILLCEQPEICRNISQNTNRFFYYPEDIGCPNWFHMAFYYNILEFNTAVKPFLIDKLFSAGYESVIYFDPDIEIFGSLSQIEELLESYSVILTPHITQPYHDDMKTPAVEDIIRAGQFNLGFIGMSSTEDSRNFLRWWQNVCIDQCLYDSKHRYFVDQFWASIIPSFVEKTYILRDPAYNIAYWNINQRSLSYADGRWFTDSGTVKFFHFSGINREDLSKVSNYQNRVTAEASEALYQLLHYYVENISNSEWAIYNEYPYSFGVYTNNKPVLKEDRKKFLFLRSADREKIQNPFDVPQRIRSIVNMQRWFILIQQYLEVWMSKGFCTANRYVLSFVFRRRKN